MLTSLILTVIQSLCFAGVLWIIRPGTPVAGLLIGGALFNVGMLLVVNTVAAR